MRLESIWDVSLNVNRLKKGIRHTGALSSKIFVGKTTGIYKGAGSSATTNSASKMTSLLEIVAVTLDPRLPLGRSSQRRDPSTSHTLELPYTQGASELNPARKLTREPCRPNQPKPKPIGRRRDTKIIFIIYLFIYPRNSYLREESYLIL